jgi:uncharacterized protein involved in exopolysaccharide biosynthesis
MKGLNENPYYFILTKRDNLVRTYAGNLKVETENEAAGTIKVMYYERNPAKASDICNSISEEFKIYDIEKQAESSTNTIKFIDTTLQLMEGDLKKANQDLKVFSQNKNIPQIESGGEIFQAQILELDRSNEEVNKKLNYYNTLSNYLRKSYEEKILKYEFKK